MLSMVYVLSMMMMCCVVASGQHGTGTSGSAGDGGKTWCGPGSEAGRCNWPSTLGGNMFERCWAVDNVLWKRVHGPFAAAVTLASVTAAATATGCRRHGFRLQARAQPFSAHRKVW